MQGPCQAQVRIHNNWARRKSTEHVTVAPPVRCFSSRTRMKSAEAQFHTVKNRETLRIILGGRQASNQELNESGSTNLPFLHLFLLPLILLDQVIQHFPQAFRIGRECRHNILYRPFHQHPIDHTEALSILRKRAQSL